MVHSFPLLIERFPAYREQALKLRFQDKVLDELCRDYDRVARSLEALNTESETISSTADERQELLSLTRKLEHEYLERIAKHAAGEQKLAHD